MSQNIFERIKKILSESPFTKLSDSVREALAIEERNGAKILNRFRYFLVTILLFIGVQGAVGKNEFLYINLHFTIVFLGITLAHTWILSKGTIKMMHAFDYISLILDNLLFLGLILYYWQLLSPENFAFVLKNPLSVMFLIPIVMTGLQFRLRLVFFALFLYSLLFGSLLWYSFRTTVPFTLDWKEYILGKAILLPAYLAIYPLTFLIITSVVWYCIYRAIRMVSRIGTVEAHKASLSKYFSPNVVEEITNNPDVIEKGMHQKVTVLFSDIRDFTKMSEGLTPNELVDLLNSVRSIQVESVFYHSGTVDKFIGDAVMATFGTPRPSSVPGKDSENAVHCAMDMLSKLKKLNLERETIGLPAIRVGIGIHTGEVFAGNIGTGNRLEYTVIGDTVNTASRIESLCKLFSKELLISDVVYSELEGKITAEKMQKTEVKGKEKLIQVYSIT